MTAIAAANHVQRFLRHVARSSDVAMVVLLMVAMAVMILPLPTMLIDALIAWNIGVSVQILIVAIYLPHPLAFSTLPAVILTATLFRLATEVAVTRLILVQVDAGEIVQAFGDFVVSGNVIVGLVTFLIITVVQFVVITKGSERVAEVAARFTLDAMPGKQMSIDSDLRGGDIDQREARRRRQLLEQESQLYGAMDGAMKFVKGDAIAGLVIVLVNLLGGIGIGCLQLGMSWGEATHTYSLLTIGDGLVSQIPALVISFAAGTIVTRVGDDSERRNLGTQITEQVAGNPRSLMLAAGALTLLGVVPGFPTFVFLTLAAAAGGRAFWLWRRERTVAAQAVAAEQASSTDPIDEAEDEPDDAAIVMAVSADLRRAPANRGVARAVRQAAATLSQDLGLEFPTVWTRTDATLPAGGFRFEIESVPSCSGVLKVDGVLLRDDPARLEPLGIQASAGAPLPGQPRVDWVSAEHSDALRAAGIAHLDTTGVLASIASDTLRRLAPHFMGVQEARRLLSRAEANYKDLAQEVQRILPLQVIAEVCRALLEEGVALRPARLILGALAEAGTKEQHPALLADYARIALSRQICHRHADAAGRLSTLIVERDAEDAIRAWAKQNNANPPVAMPETPLNSFVTAIRHRVATRPVTAGPFVLLASYDVRRLVRAFLVRNEVDVPVFSYQELAQDISVQPLGSVGCGAPSESSSTRVVVQGNNGAASANELRV